MCNKATANQTLFANYCVFGSRIPLGADLSTFSLQFCKQWLQRAMLGLCSTSQCSAIPASFTCYPNTHPPWGWVHAITLSKPSSSLTPYYALSSFPVLFPTKTIWTLSLLACSFPSPLLNSTLQRSSCLIPPAWEMHLHVVVFSDICDGWINKSSFQAMNAKRYKLSLLPSFTYTWKSMNFESFTS